MNSLVKSGLLFYDSDVLSIHTKTLDNISGSLLAISAGFLTLSSSISLRAEEALGSTDFPKHFHWQGEAKGETVTMDIDAAPFVAAKHKVRHDGGIIDGYPAEPGYLRSWGSGFPYFTIANWTIRWGRKRLRPFPRGIYTSVLTPHLRVSEDADFKLDVPVKVEVCADGDALLVMMGYGYDGVTGTIVFVITKDGRIHRFITEVKS